MPTILDQIVATKRLEVAAARERIPVSELERSLASAPAVRKFGKELRVPGEVRIIAEVKKASPSAGVLREPFDPVAIAQSYDHHGAACLSILTDETYFQGRLQYLSSIRQAVHRPLLRKEFIIDPYQIVEARVAGADAVLLIAEILPGALLKQLFDQARSLGMDVLIELHDAEQLPRVLATGTTLLGINNRDLRTFHTDLNHTLTLLPEIPGHVTVVSESGIRTNEDLARLQQAGVHAVLVGESLMRAPDPGVALDSLRGGR